MGRFSVPSSPARNVVKIETFKGVDLNSSPSNVEITRSPNAPNMMRDVPGKVRKRQGYERIAQFSGKRINGVHILRSAEKNEEKVLIHAGDSLYLEGKAISTESYSFLTGRRHFATANLKQRKQPQPRRTRRKSRRRSW